MTDDRTRHLLLEEYRRLVNLAVERSIGARERLFRYLVAVNAGGAIATLGFIGSAQSLGPNPWAAIAAIFSFSFGLIVCGIFLLLSAISYRKGIRRRRNILDLVRTGEIDSTSARQKFEGVPLSSVGLHYAFWPAFVPFVAGILFGAIAIWPAAIAAG